MASAATEEPRRVPSADTMYSWVMPLPDDCMRGALNGSPANKQGCRTSRAHDRASALFKCWFGCVTHSQQEQTYMLACCCMLTHITSAPRISGSAVLGARRCSTCRSAGSQASLAEANCMLAYCCMLTHSTSVQATESNMTLQCWVPDMPGRAGSHSP
jgi:hypothetical protein